jgi:hypothetical protein
MVSPIKPVSPVQKEFDFGDNPEKQQRGKTGPSPFDEVLDREKDAREKAKNKAAENEEFKDKRVKASPLVVESELARMKEILSKSKGGGGGGGVPKSNRDLTKNYKKGGKVSSASKRADGCCVKGKTKGRMV